MSYFIWIAIASMCIITLAHHLGFIENAYKICGKIVKCPMCSTFWGALFVLLIINCHILEAVAISFVMAYLSNWFGLILNKIANIYEIIWQKNKKNKT